MLRHLLNLRLLICLFLLLDTFNIYRPILLISHARQKTQLPEEDLLHTLIALCESLLSRSRGRLKVFCKILNVHCRLLTFLLRQVVLVHKCFRRVGVVVTGSLSHHRTDV